MAFFRDDEALGLPKGTIRGIALLVIVGTVCALAVLQKEVPDALSMAFSTLIGFYYGTKKAQNGPSG
jgi:hypothetical protein